MSLSIGSVVAAIITGALIFYVRSCLQFAERQKMAARRLHGYISYWKSWALDNNAFAIVNEGFELNKTIDALSSADNYGQVAVEKTEEKKQEIEEKVDQFVNDTDLEALSGLKQLIDRIPTQIVNRASDIAQQAEQNLVDGKTFVTDEEASVLGRDVVIRCIKVKSIISQLVFTVVHLLLIYRQGGASRELKEYRDQIVEIVWKLVELGWHIEYLTNRCDRIERQPIPKLAWRQFSLSD